MPSPRSQSHLRDQPLNPSDQIAHKLLAFWHRGEDPEIMRQALIMVMLRGDAGFLQRRFHHIGVISQWVLLTADKVCWRKVLMILGGQSSEDVAIFRVGTGMVVESLHRIFVNNRNILLVFFIRLVNGLVLGWHIVKVEGAGDDGGNAFDRTAL